MFKKKYKVYVMTDLVDVWYQIKVGYFLFYWWVREDEKISPMKFDSLEEADYQIKVWSELENQLV